MRNSWLRPCSYGVDGCSLRLRTVTNSLASRVGCCVEVQIWLCFIGCQLPPRRHTEVHLSVRRRDQAVASGCHVIMRLCLQRFVVRLVVRLAIEPAFCVLEACATTCVSLRVAAVALEQRLEHTPLPIDVVQLEVGFVITVFSVEKVGVAHSKPLQLLDYKVGRPSVGLLDRGGQQQLCNFTSTDLQLAGRIVALWLFGSTSASCAS